MRTRHRLAGRGIAAALLAVACLAAVAPIAAAETAPTTIHFTEVEKGSTFTFIDNAPKSKLQHGFPEQISAGDQFVGTTPLVSEGKSIGTLRDTCTATNSVSAKNFDGAGFICNGVFDFSNGSTLVAAAVIGKHSGTEGAITGGTGIYAGARGTFVTKEGKGSSAVTVTVTLLE